MSAALGQCIHDFVPEVLLLSTAKRIENYVSVFWIPTQEELSYKKQQEYQQIEKFSLPPLPEADQTCAAFIH